jgi:hypothetical protein
VNGIASLPSWKLGESFGQYHATAYVAGLPPIEFVATARGPLIATYDLVSIDGIQFPGPSLTEAHYFLYKDGSFVQVYNEPVTASVGSRIGGTFTISGDRSIDFDFPGPQSARATLDGQRMSVTYLYDEIDFPKEEYVLR